MDERGPSDIPSTGAANRAADSNLPGVNEPYLPVPAQQRRIRIEPHGRPQHRLLIAGKIVARFPAPAFAKLPGDVDAALTVDGDQATVERAVEGGRQENPVGGIMPVLRVEAPRPDMARHQQPRVGDAGDRAALLIIGKRGAAEEGLAEALLDEGLGGRRALPRIEPEFGALVPGAGPGLRLARRIDLRLPEGLGAADQPGPVVAELGIKRPVPLRGAGQALAAGFGDLRVEARDVAQFHRDRARRSADGGGELPDLRIAGMEAAEGELEIEVEREDGFLVGPVSPVAGGVLHGGRYGPRVARCKGTVTGRPVAAQVAIRSLGSWAAARKGG